jgi:3-hydroxypropanoate dehydrogenase
MRRIPCSGWFPFRRRGGSIVRGRLNGYALDTLFLGARSQNRWTERPIAPGELKRLYGLLRFAPTSMNCLPARFVFCVSEESKNRLAKACLPNNVPKVLGAPATVIVAYDSRFHEHLPRLFPHLPDVATAFAADAALAQETAFRNSSIQGAFLIVAARALGLDCGPMSGFDNTVVDRTFFPDGRFKSNFICGLGEGDPEAVFPRLPRFEFDEACQVL